MVLPGAQPALGGTPGMMGYGMAKAAIHQLTKSLASADSGLPSDAKTFALLPITLGMYKKGVTTKRIKYIYIYIYILSKRMLITFSDTKRSNYVPYEFQFFR